MSVFYLNYANSFLAIPLTLFGLGAGSLAVHIRRDGVARADLAVDLGRLAYAAVASFALAFLLFSQFFPITHRTRLASLLMTGKTFAFVALFLPPFYYVGKILTVLYARHRAHIGRLYGSDLFGAAAACFVTPVLFHFIDLPYLIATGLVALSLLAALAPEGGARRARLRRLVPVALLILPVLVFLEGRYDMRHALGYTKKVTVTEIAHRWNEFSRVSLLRLQRAGRDKPTYQIIHDNAESNVYVEPYRPEGATPSMRQDIRLPFLLNRPTDDVLVMFAGSGKQMIEYAAHGGGKSRLTGVELNPLVIKFATEPAPLAGYHLREFYARPNVHMEIKEGRRFLDNDPNRYDVIYVGSDAATSQYKSGHSRKYLDTKEAMAAYLDHLRADGLLVFRCHPSAHLVESLKWLSAERGQGPLSERVMIFAKRTTRCDDLIYSLRPFARDETAAVVREYPGLLRYAPHRLKNHPRYTASVENPPDPERLVTDDRPYARKLDFKRWRLFPSMKKLDSRAYYRSWIKITTLLAIGVLLAGILAALYATRVTMPPPGMMLYLVVTGFCYMLVEITYLGKMELFLESPLYSMALLLSIFLLTNAAGATVFHRIGDRLPMRAMPIFVAAIVLSTSWAMTVLIKARIGMPLAAKIPLATLVLAPAGFCLGLFYPYVVTWLARRGNDAAIPVTYGISTLSSVAGATFAMAMIINHGYTNVLALAAVLYGVLTAVLMAFRRLTA